MSAQDIIIFAIVFIITFFIGGAIAVFTFPSFPGLFYIGGLIFAAFATGVGTLIIRVIINR